MDCKGIDHIAYLCNKPAEEDRLYPLNQGLFRNHIGLKLLHDRSSTILFSGHSGAIPLCDDHWPIIAISHQLYV